MYIHVKANKSYQYPNDLGVKSTLNTSVYINIDDSVINISHII